MELLRHLERRLDAWLQAETVESGYTGTGTLPDKKTVDEWRESLNAQSKFISWLSVYALLRDITGRTISTVKISDDKGGFSYIDTMRIHSGRAGEHDRDVALCGPASNRYGVIFTPALKGQEGGEIVCESNADFLNEILRLYPQ